VRHSLVVRIDFFEMLEVTLIHRFEIWTCLAEVVQATLHYLIVWTILILMSNFILPITLDSSIP
jgi:hypothetical protein